MNNDVLPTAAALAAAALPAATPLAFVVMEVAAD